MNFLRTITIIVFSMSAILQADNVSDLEDTAGKFEDWGKGAWQGVKDIAENPCVKILVDAIISAAAPDSGTAIQASGQTSYITPTPDDLTQCSNYFKGIGLPGANARFAVVNDAPVSVLLAYQQMRIVMGIQMTVTPEKQYAADSKFGGSFTNAWNIKPFDYYRAAKEVDLWAALYAFTSSDQKTEYPKTYNDAVDRVKNAVGVGMSVSNNKLVIASNPFQEEQGLDAIKDTLFGTEAYAQKSLVYQLKTTLSYDDKGQPIKDDPNVMFFRIYKTYPNKIADKDEMHDDARDQNPIKGELLNGGVKDLLALSKDFSGALYNSTKAPVLVRYYVPEKTDPYIVTLEPNTFNYLQIKRIQPAKGATHDDIFAKLMSERSGLSFFQGPIDRKSSSFQSILAAAAIAYYPLLPEGLGYLSTYRDGAQKGQQYVAGPMQYTLELYDDSGTTRLANHAMTPGKFPMPVETTSKLVQGKAFTIKEDETITTVVPNSKKPTRYISPLAINIWKNDAAQELADMLKQTGTAMSYEQIPFNAPESIWAAYVTTDSEVYQLITTTTSSFDIIRPQVSEKKAWLYICSLNTTDATKARAFLQRLAAGIIGGQAKTAHTEVTAIPDDAALGAAAITLQPNTFGIIDDTAGSGVSGALLNVDQFMPYGLGDMPGYYHVFSPYLLVGQLAQVMQLPESYDQKVFAINVMQWIIDYAAGKTADVKTSVVAYLQTQKVSTTDAKFVDRIMTGPISIKNYPLRRRAGTNYPAQGMPDDWPK